MKQVQSGHELSDRITLQAPVKISELPYGLPKAHMAYKRPAKQYDVRMRTDIPECGK